MDKLGLWQFDLEDIGVIMQRLSETGTAGQALLVIPHWMSLCAGADVETLGATLVAVLPVVQCCLDGRCHALA